MAGRQLHLMRWTAAVAAIALAYGVANPFLVRRLLGISTAPNKIIFLLFHVAAVLLLLAAARAAWFVAVPIVLASALSVALDVSYLAVTHRPMALGDLAVMLATAGNTGDAVRAFQPDIAKGVLAAGLIVVAVLFARDQLGRARFAARSALALVVALMAGYAGLAVARGEPALIALPTTSSLAVGGAILWSDSTLRAMKPRKFSRAERAERLPVADPPKRIVLVIDESVEADRFTEANERPFRHAVDLGRAFSASNCSASANFILRCGLDAHDLSRRTQPLFELAREAGFRTVYVDAQGVLGDTAVRDYFSDAELAFVDRVYEPREFGPDRAERDHAVAAQLPAILTAHERTFVIVNKVGSHYPYAAALPSRFADAADPYLASIIYSSIEFLHRVDATLPASTVVFYTSDHGQDFKARVPHCNPAPDNALAEWRVPDIVLASDDLAPLRERLDLRWRDRGSHFEIAETIRALLGYRPLFGPTLFDPPPPGDVQYRAYWGPVNGLLGAPARFREFDRGALEAGSNGGPDVQRRAGRSPTVLRH